MPASIYRANFHTRCTFGALHTRGLVMVRIAWSIPGHGSGHGEWLSSDRYIKAWVDSMNKEHGPGTHWLDYK